MLLYVFNIVPLFFSISPLRASASMGGGLGAGFKNKNIKKDKKEKKEESKLTEEEEFKPSAIIDKVVIPEPEIIQPEKPEIKEKITESKGLISPESFDIEPKAAKAQEETIIAEKQPNIFRRFFNYIYDNVKKIFNKK